MAGMSPETRERLRSALGAKNAPDPRDLELLEKARKWAPRFARLPGVRMAAVCNSASMFAAKASSDIDLFVVAEPGRIWLARVLCTALAHFSGHRRHGADVADRFCLSFFCAADALDFSGIALPGGDPYLEEWVRNLKPVADFGGTADAFWDANAALAEVSPEDRARNRGWLAVSGPAPRRNAFSFLGAWADRLCRAAFLAKTVRHWERLGKPWGVVISDRMLKFHDKDRRRELKALAEAR